MAMKDQKITTVDGVKEAIYNCAEVRKNVRFGNCEIWATISRNAALDLFDVMQPTDKPSDDIYGNVTDFGEVIDNCFYMGN